MIDWQAYAAPLVVGLLRDEILAPEWLTAFQQVPRHVFVPVFYTLDGDEVGGDDPAQREQWLSAVYSDQSLTTQMRAAPGAELLWPTSSSTRPSLMARMLGLLDVRAGLRVLEIGTGTGWNAALLSHRLGDHAVTSIDIDPTLVDTARERLASLGYRPYLTAGDGVDGVPQRAPYDRIIATCGVAVIPAPWITQLSDGGLIVADVRGELGSSLIVARKTGPHTVSGQFLANPGHFMWMRATVDNPLRHGGSFGAAYDFTDPRTEPTGIPLTAFDNTEFLFFLQLMVPGLGPIGHTIRDGRDGVFLVADEDMSWVEISPGTASTSTVVYGGPRQLWPTIAEAWHRWNDLGHPAHNRFGLTAHDTGEQHIWLDHDQKPVRHTQRNR